MGSDSIIRGKKKSSYPVWSFKRATMIMSSVQNNNRSYDYSSPSSDTSQLIICSFTCKAEGKLWVENKWLSVSAISRWRCWALIWDYGKTVDWIGSTVVPRIMISCCTNMICTACRPAQRCCGTSRNTCKWFCNDGSGSAHQMASSVV
jgi:hypothetical protein